MANKASKKDARVIIPIRMDRAIHHELMKIFLDGQTSYQKVITKFLFILLSNYRKSKGPRQKHEK